MAEFVLSSSQLREYSEKLSCGDRVLLSGTVYTARDAAHKRIVTLMKKGEKLPFESYVKIDNTGLLPTLVAKMIKEKFKLI